MVFEIDMPAWAITAIWIALFLFLATLGVRFSERFGRRIARIYKNRERQPLTLERQMTLGSIFAGTVRLFSLTAALLAILALFVSIESLVWMVGLFSAAFGLGARPFISDILTGFTFITENTFSVGEKVEMLGVSGVVEKVQLRTTRLRAPSGELYILPNGDIRTIRNFSRGKFSQVKVTLRIHSANYEQALPLLDNLGQEAVSILPNLIEPWKVLSEGELGERAALVIVAKARFGKGADMTPRLEALVQQRFAEAQIDLV